MPEIQKALYDIQGNKINQETSAAAVSVSDPSNYFAATNVEDALAETVNIVSTNTGIPATNLVANGDFSGGTTGWTGITAVVGGRASKLATGAWQYMSRTINSVIGNKYYISGTVEGTTNNYFGNLALGVYLPTNGVHKISKIFTATATSFGFGMGDKSSSGWATFYMDNLLVIDLTATFGAGKEPGISEMDSIMALYPNYWFDGTVNPLVTSKQIFDKVVGNKPKYEMIGTTSFNAANQYYEADATSHVLYFKLKYDLYVNYQEVETFYTVAKYLTDLSASLVTSPLGETNCVSMSRKVLVYDKINLKLELKDALSYIDLSKYIVVLSTKKEFVTGGILYPEYIKLKLDGVNSDITSLANQAISDVSTTLLTADKTKFESFITAYQVNEGRDFSFALQSDTHYLHTDATHRAGVNSFSKLSGFKNFDYIGNLGDVVRGYEFDNYETSQKSWSYFMHDIKANAKCPVLLVKGNHDDGSLYSSYESLGLESTICPDEMYGRVFKGLRKDITVYGGDGYYYKNFDEYKIRVIVLNSVDIPYEETEAGLLKYIGIYKYAYRNAQINWLANTALTVASDWKVIVMTHIPLDGNLLDVPSGIATNTAPILGILNAFNTGATYTGSGTETDFEYSVSCDYGVQGAGTVVCVLCGHNHYDRATVLDGINHISIKNGVANAKLYHVSATELLETDYVTLVTRAWSY